MAVTSFSAALLASVFAASAWLKIDHFLIRGDWATSVPVLRSGGVVASIALAELSIAIMLLRATTRRAGAWLAIGFCVGANLFLAGVRYYHPPAVSCGCLGNVPLSIGTHMLLNGSIALLAAIVISCAPDAEPTAVVPGSRS
jgi:hypothetical protein